MRVTDPLHPILGLIGDPGFRSKDDLGSFCLSVGLYHGIKSDVERDPPRNWDPSRYGTWPMLEVIVHTMDPTIHEQSEIKHFLFQYYLGGAGMVRKKVTEKSGISALKQLSQFIAP